MFHTVICDLLGIRYPVLQGAMQGGGGVDLVAAVSEAGGLGVLPTFGGTDQKLRADIAAVRARTNRPFGVNIMPMGRGITERCAATCMELGVPIVMITGDDPVRSGYVASLARPGGNITGVTFLTVDLFAKQMELLKQLVPNVKRVAILWDPAMPSTTQDLMDVRAAAERLGLQLKVTEARGAPGDYESAFVAMSAERIEGVVIAGKWWHPR